MERLHGFFDWRIIIEAVALEQIDIVELKALQRGFDRVEDVLYDILVVCREKT